MRLGLIARADSRGLGIQTRAFHDNMHPVKTLVVDCPSMKPLAIRRDWFPYATWVRGLPGIRDFERWFRGLDAVYSAETFYSQQVYGLANRLGVKTVQHLNYEFLDVRDRPTIWAAPSKWHWNQIPNPKVHLPVPVETHRFTPQPAPHATNFLHIIGRPAVHDRAGTLDLLLALQSVHSDIAVTITCQEPGYVKTLIAANNIKLHDNIDLRVSDGDVPNYWDLYTNQHVMIAPRRYGGLSLPMQEACAAGIPVIAPAISPQTDWLPTDWLINARKTSQFMVKTLIDIHATDHLALAAKISQFANNPTYYREAAEQAITIGKSLSWSELKPLYQHVLGA
jgi:hypothetical protein